MATVVGPLASSTISYTYDELERTLTNSVDGTNNRITYTFDSLGRVSRYS